MEDLRELYLDDLRRPVPYNENMRPRVRKVEAVWAKIESSFADPPVNIGAYENVWVWSDTHFFHTNVIKYCDRPFNDINEMNEALIANHNSVVGDNDLVIWVGDVAFAGATKANAVLDRLKGDRILVIGNHDINKKKVRQLNFKETHLLYVVDDDVCPLVFTHYTFDNLPWPWVNIHGHVHNSAHAQQNSLQHINVSIEVIDYTPVNLEVLKRQARTRLESLDK